MKAEDWSYVAEGNANIVVQYTGSDPRYISKVLRLSKQTSLRSNFTLAVIKRLFGDEYYQQTSDINVEGRFLVELSNIIEPSRPQSRVHKSIDTSQKTAAMMENLIIQDDSITVEIKPKWGFLTDDYNGSCRFCAHSIII
jgi:inositol-pentakisphosphate 2-kinase